MNHRASLLFAGLAVAAFSSGCKGATPSDTVATGDIVATIDAYDDGVGPVVVTTRLEVARNGSDVRLVGDDRLEAFFGDRSAPMTDVGGGRYEADFDYEEVADVGVVFDRGKFDPAPDSFGVLPDPLELGGFEGLVISRGLDSIVLELPATSFDKTVDLSGPCVSSLVYDVGPYAEDVVVNPGDLYASNPNSECDVTITITSTTYGSPDPALHPDSSFVLSRSRSTSFYSVP